MAYTSITSKEVAEGLKGARPKFEIWVWHAFGQGYLDLLAESIIKTGRATNGREAILYLANVSGSLSQKRKVNWTDINGTSNHNLLLKKLSFLLTGEKQRKESDLSRFYGTISHSAVSDLWLGNLERIPKKRISRFLAEQMTLFPNGHHDLFYEMKNQREKNFLWPKTIARIEEEWEELRQEMEKGNIPLYSRTFQKLEKNLELVFKDHFLKVKNHAIMEGQYLAFLTFMTWAGAVVYHKHAGNRTFFREIPLLPYDYDLGAGRLDALFVNKIGNLHPDPDQIQKIQEMTKHQFLSVGHITRQLLDLFGAQIELKIVDWKFGVGDGPKTFSSQLNVIKEKQVTEKTLPEHAEQLKRYITMTMLSHSLTASGQENNEIWKTNDLVIKGRVAYLFPNRITPILHPVELEPEEIKSFFRDKIAANFSIAEGRAQIRYQNNALIGHSIELITNSGNGKMISRKNGAQTVMEELLVQSEVKNPAKSIATIIEEHRPAPRFADENNIIEIVREWRGKPVHEMHIDRLLKAMSEGKVETPRYFNQTRGGSIKCLVHSERTPSMHISFMKGMFKCFGCGAGGSFAQSSIPNDMHIVMQPRKKLAMGQIVIPERHQEIMKTAQMILQASFPGSSGREYLAKERKLDPDLSFARGAGFANERLIKSLLDSGFTREEINYYGFFTVNDNPIFNNMVTYPLEIGGIINSFYGRSIDPNCDKRFIHRKLSNEKNNMPHGAFNLWNAMNSGATSLVVEEAAINADTLLQKSPCSAVTAILGVNNPVLVDLLSEFNSDIILALNWDEKSETGQRNTIKLAEELKQRGFKHRIYDFTGAFVKSLAEFSPDEHYKDANQYWKDYGKQIPVFQNLLQL